MERRPFDWIQEGERLARSGQGPQAEAALKRGVSAYERYEPDGVAFALGRLGDFYISQDRIQDAREALTRAIRLHDPPPRAFHDLLGLLADHGEPDEFFETLQLWLKLEETQAKRWIAQGHGVTIASMQEPIYHDALKMVARTARKEKPRQALPLLERLLPKLQAVGLTELHWQARGLIGKAYEQSDLVETAIEHYTRAVLEGSRDRHTYTRLLTLLEKQRDYERALEICNQALKHNPDASWLVDLRKRQARLEARTSTKGKARQAIRYYVIRSGETHLVLRHQFKVSPPPRRFGFHNGMRAALISASGNSPHLSCWSIDGERRLWQAPGKVSGFVVGPNSVLTWERHGRIGEAPSTLTFIDLNGLAQKVTTIPDAVTEAVSGSDEFYVGCRDGFLYAFRADGHSLWSYQVPTSGSQAGSSELPEARHPRPCPWFLATIGDGNGVVYSSFRRLELLDDLGAPRVHVEAPSEISSLSVPNNGSNLLVVAGGQASSFDGLEFSLREVRRAWLGSPESRLAFFLVGNGLSGYALHVVKNEETIAVLDNVTWHTNVTVHPGHGLCAINSEKDIWLINRSGNAFAHLELARPLAGLAFSDDQLIVAAGYLMAFAIVLKAEID